MNELWLVGAILTDKISDSDLIKIFWIDENLFSLLKTEILRIEEDINLCERKRDVLLKQLDEANLIKYWKKEIQF